MTNPFVIHAVYTDQDESGFVLESVTENDDRQAIADMVALHGRGFRRPVRLKFYGDSRDEAWDAFTAYEDRRAELNFG